MDIGADGVYYFQTEFPGDENASGWGPDPEAHFHYDITCDGCANSFTKRYWNKFYFDKLCQLDLCKTGGKGPTTAHQVTKLSAGVYKYDMVV
jgi:hypothetical protein